MCDVSSGGFDSEFIPKLREVEDRHFWFRSRNAVIAALTEQIELHLTPGYRVLEVGCGTGNTLRVLHEICNRGRVFGLDFQREGFRYARERVPCALVQADIRRPPFLADVWFDLIGIFDVLEHIPDDREALAQTRELLTPGGVLMLTVPGAPALWSYFDEAARHCRRYSAIDLSDRLLEAGFRIEYLSPFMTSLYPFAWLRRRLAHARWRPSQGASRLAAADLDVSPIANSVLSALLRPERTWVRSRRRLPFGTSLLAIAMKQ